jgi:hypothetical protein
MHPAWGDSTLFFNQEQDLIEITIDNASLPTSALLNVAFGYLLGMGFLGYMTLWAWFKERATRSYWHPWLTNLLIGIHFVLGLAAVGIAPASLLHRLKAQGANSTAGAIAFTLPILVVLCLCWLIAKDWNRWFGSRREGKTSDQ